MSLRFELIDSRATPIGEISLRRRRIAQLDDTEVFEVKLGDEYLMSSLFPVVEIALADLGLAACRPGALDVLVGGLGLGYTAVAALKNPRVKSLVVAEMLEAVIDWHTQGLVPLGTSLTSDSRCRLVQQNFFAAAADPASGFDPQQPGRRFHAILLDIDHSPKDVLADGNAALYQKDGLEKLAEHLLPNGIFALWSNDPPDLEFMETLNAVFVDVESHVVKFPNPLLESESANTVYVARKYLAT